MGIIKRGGQGGLVSVTRTGSLHEYDLPKKYLLPIEMALTSQGAYWMALQSFKKGVAVSTVYQLR